MADDDVNPQQTAMAQFALFQQFQNMQQGKMPGSFPQPQVAPPSADEEEEEDEFGIIKPATLRPKVVDQTGFQVSKDKIGPLDRLFLKRDTTEALGGIPSGCTTVLSGGPGSGKSRCGMEAVIMVASRGVKVGAIFAEEGYYDDSDSGREDLMSRIGRMGMELLGMDYPTFKKEVENNMVVFNPTYDIGLSWEDFTKAYNALIEKYGCKFMLIDSINALDPSARNLKQNLAGLKTYNHKHGVTCLIIGQVGSGGGVQGGDPLIHESDAHVHIEKVNLTTKAQQADWGVDAKQSIQVVRSLKSVTTTIYPYPGRCEVDDEGFFRFTSDGTQAHVLPTAE